MKKNLFYSAILFFLFSCGDDKKEINYDSLRNDSALKAQQNIAPQIPTDTANKSTLPTVMEGDLVFQISEDEQSRVFGLASHSNYNNVGLIFLRAKDKQYMVMEVKDSLHATPLKEWADRGKDKHFALLRLKEANMILNEKKILSLKSLGKSLRGKKFDIYYNWSNEALYPSEMVWKLYKNGANVTLCEPGKLSQFDLSDPLVKQQMKNKYGAAIPADEQVITPQDLYKSPRLEVIFER